MVLTDEVKRVLRDYLPSLSNRPPGVDLGALLESAASQAALDADVANLAKISSAQATILNGNTSVTVAVGAAFAGKRAVVSFAEAPTAAALVWSDDVTVGGDLVISIDVNNTADLKVNYILDGR